MLIQLPEGSWVKPEEVTSVRIWTTAEARCVTVEYGHGGNIVHPVDTLEEAQQLRDDISDQVNRALYSGGKQC